MAISNTNILIKRSSSTRQPSSLAAGELAYSYLSNTLFLGSSTGSGVINVGGLYYTQSIDEATSAGTPGTIVRRDASGNATFGNVIVTGTISGTIEGVANSAVRLQTPRNFSISGGDIAASAVSFDGSGAVTLNASLNAIPGLSAGSYGSSTEIPVVTVAANGRVTSISTQSITTSFTAAADSGASQTISGGDTLTLTGGSGITSTASATDRITFDVDNTVVRSNTAITNQTIDGSVTIAGNLIVQGTQTTINTVTLNIADPLLILASNNSADAIDIGFAGHYNDGTDRHTGFFRDAGTKEYYVFDGYTPELYSNNSIDVAAASFRTANVNAGYIKTTGVFANGINLGSQAQNIYDLANTHTSALSSNAAAITIIQGVNTTQNTNITAADTKAQNAFDKANNSVQASTDFTFGQMVVADGTDSLKSLANASYTLTGTLSAAKTISSLTVDAYGRVTAATGSDIAIAASQISSGEVSVTRGGTGQASFTTGAILVGNGTGALQTLANSNFTATGSGAANNTVSSLTVDAYGRVTAATFSAISGLTVGQGGTGRSTFTTNGIVYGNSTDGQLVTAVAGGADQTWSNQILTVTNAGVPVWTSALDGGTF
jgi:hypothetical protein